MNIFRKSKDLFEYFIKLIPLLANYNKKTFIEKFGNQIIMELLGLLNQLNYKNRNLMFKQFSEIIEMYKKDEIKLICI